MKKILVTGASGFIGSFIVERALELGFEVFAGLRSSSNRRYLTDPAIQFLELDFTKQDLLKQSLADFKNKHSRFDYIIHCAGVTKCKNKSEFVEVNYLQTKSFVDVLIELDIVPKQFLFVSTLSVFGPIKELDYKPITESDVRNPNTAYGLSKLRTELFLESLTGFPYVVFRPTGVYGPRETDYFLMVKSIKSHLDFSVGYKRQDLTFVYVKDLVESLFLAIDKGVTNRSYFVTDGEVYNSRKFSELIQEELGVGFVLRIKSPLIVLKGISLFAEFIASIFGKSSTLNSDKYKIMKQRNWRCDITPTIDELGYKPKYKLKEGVREAVSWYKKEKWI